MEDRINNIISIDAGGLKGIYSMIIVDGLAEKFHINFNLQFQYYIGTSIGSIISSALACGMSPKEIIDAFIGLKDDFDKGHIYLIQRLFNLIDELFGNKILSQVTSNLFIPIYNFSRRSLDYFSNKNNPDIFLSDALKASCSDIRIIKPYKIAALGAEYTDAGFFAYDPIIFFLQKDNLKLDSNLRIMSIGSGLITNLADDLNISMNLDIIYDSFLYTQFEANNFFFSQISEVTGLKYQRISEFPLETKQLSISHIIQLANEKLTTITTTIFD